MAAKLNIDALRDFAECVKEEPSVLFTPELAFLKSALGVYGDLRMPSLPKKAAPSTSASHDHDHSHGHEHSHSGSCGHAPAPEEPEEEEPEDEEEEDPERMASDAEPYLPLPVGSESDYDASGVAKDAANDAKASGDYTEAINKYTEAMTLGSVSALTLANRAEVLLKARRPNAAIADCTAALDINPDSAKALRFG
jgi:suppressor of tumorigenicity protein 13